MLKKIHIKEEELYHISPFFQGIMDLAFDESCIMDRNGYIIHCSESSPLIWGRPNEESVGMHITELDSASPYPELLETGKAVLGKIHIINGMTCITHMIPLFNEEDELIGAFGVIIFRGMEKLKNLMRDKNLDAQSKALYAQISRAEARYSLWDFVGQSPKVSQVLSLARKAASYDVPVLIRGETGCGKEIIANGIHTESVARQRTPFVKINCTAIPRDLLESELFGYEKGAFTGAYSTKQGKFEIAGNGTILLDELGDLDAAMQSKLLRVIEEREFERLGGNTLLPLHARIIASTNRNLEEMIREGKFREDLYYRLSAIEIQIPPLRERREDVMLLMNHFLAQLNLDTPFTPEAIALIKDYDWPGNVRQLRNLVTKLSLLDDQEVFDRQDIAQALKLEPEYLPKAADDRLGDGVRDVEREMVIRALEECNMCISHAARKLGISRSTLYSKIKKLEIELEKSIHT